MKEAIKSLLSSKKFLTAIVATLVALGGRYGLDIDPEIVALIVGTFAAVIIGQGVADHGKEAARIAASSPPPPVNVVNQVVEKSNQLSLLILLISIAPAALLTSSCGAARSGAGAAGSSFINCMAPDVQTASGELVPAMSSALRSVVAGNGSVDRGQFRAIASPLKSAASRCAIKAAIDGMIEAVRQGDVSAAPPALDAEGLKAALEETRATDWGGVRMGVAP